MIELKRDALTFSFPEVSPDASLAINFQRTLRIPDDDKTYPLPPGLGNFPLRHVDDFADHVSPAWLEHGGVMLPMYQSEAMWLYFSPNFVRERVTCYPCAVKIAAGKINACTGETWTNDLHAQPQDYLVTPHQPWLDGYCVEKGIIRQFVAMPLGSGYSAEEQITGRAEHGGLQIVVYPMKREVFERRFPKRSSVLRRRSRGGFGDLDDDVALGLADSCVDRRVDRSMALAPGGRMRQEIYEDPFDFADWDTARAARCFVHIANSLVWHAITGQRPPHAPPTSKQYTRAGLPWFDYYGDGPALPAQGTLQKLKSIVGLAKEKGDNPLPENESVAVKHVIPLRRGLGEDQVREGAF